MQTPRVDSSQLGVFLPLETPNSPDADSKTGPTYIPDGAPNQVFRINLRLQTH